MDEAQTLVLSNDPSAWQGEHYFSVTRAVPGQETVHVTGAFFTKVFEGPCRQVPRWEKAMEAFVDGKGKRAKKVCFFYTTCPRCAKYHGENHVVAVAEIH